jgi:hypothetical protein
VSLCGWLLTAAATGTSSLHKNTMPGAGGAYCGGCAQ